MSRVGLNKKTIVQVPLDGQTVLVRADYNVPLDSKGQIADDYRMQMSLPTLKNLLSRGCRVVICAHLGRPDGKPNSTYSLEPVAHHLVELLGQPVKFVSDCVGDKAMQASRRLKKGEVLLLENLRFHPEEEANDRQFAKSLAKASRASYFVQDGFGVVHRAHASTSAITEFLPSVAGKLLEKEVTTITRAMEKPERPLVAVLGGAKISDKIGLVERFVKIADRVVIGGAMANTFLTDKGVDIGASLSETDLQDVIRLIYKAAGDQTDKLILPEDVAVGKTTDQAEPRREVELDQIAADDKILDIGPKTIEKVAAAVDTAKTVVWNGTLGYAELDQFAHGSARTALELARRRGQVESIIGGGDTADFVINWDANHGASFSHVSTGGGASLELMAGQKLPGVEALLDD
ncbi:MAG TPA: phosphoglycerate kinase [Candidatus Saccharimonadales bacterium]|nr:phosphoglycerate kinase [Candidatus Saccharimonadales bacterium]